MKNQQLVANILSEEETKALKRSFTTLVGKFQSNDGKLNLVDFIPILGNPPTIPDSPDMDARMEAWEEKAEYGRKVEFIETLLKQQSH